MRERGQRAILHSDGNVAPLIPLFLEAIQSRQKLWIELEPSQPAPRQLRFAPQRLELRVSGCHARGRAEHAPVNVVSLRHIEYAEST